MDRRSKRPADRDARTQLLRAFEARGWREMKLEERLDHAHELERRPGLATAFERAANERPQRLAVTNDREPQEPAGPAGELDEGLDVVRDILNREARDVGWALVGLDWDYWGPDPDDPFTGYFLYATFAPLGRSLGKGGRGGHQQIPDDVVLEILIQRGEGKGPRKIANELNETGIRPPRGRQWWPSTVQTVLKSDYAQRIARDAQEGSGA
jgi:recombinase